ncbi:MAG TPA: SpoIIE family protein phosphatase [Sporichthya sp.]|nr:SpoIIE family protein phosphatase [Sporichthya sp.]
MTVGDNGALDEFLDALLEDDPAQLYDRAPCGYLSTTPDGTITKVNETFLTLSGFGRDELVGRRRFADLLTRGGQIYHETHYAPMLRMQGAAREIALDLVRSDGQRLPVLVNSVLETDSNGAPALVRTAVFDATQRRQYERELVRAKQRAEASEAEAVALARTLQQTLIPPATPHVPGLDVAAEYRPAGDGTEVGGDFYDIFQVSDGDWVVVVGDVAGKGVAAAVVTALVRWGVRAAVVQHESPRVALAAVNESLLRHETERFCTVALVRLIRIDGSWVAVMCAGGHDLPLLRKADGTLRTVGEPGSVLGVMPDPELADYPMVLDEGDTMLLFTDGLPEGRQGREFYGDRRIGAVVAREHSSAAALVANLVADVVDFQGGDTRDDIAVVAIRVPAGTGVLSGAG